MKTEYLITFDGQDGMCSDIEKFKSMLMSHSRIGFGKGSIIKIDGRDLNYVLATGKMSDGSIYYDFTLECTNDDFLDLYGDLLKEIRKVCGKFNGRGAIVLMDGIGEKYCQLGYPIVYKTENLMRKLISKFMAINIGIDWVDATAPKEVMESLRTEGKRDKYNLLQEVDFIQISNFLFKNYTKNDFPKFIDSIKNKNDEECIKVSELKEYAPATNWEKYFAKNVKCESEYIRSKWDKLYALRCKIAHCRSITHEEYEELKVLAEDVCLKIQAALDSIQDIQISESERENLAENMSGALNDKVADFLAAYNKMAKILHLMCALTSGEDDIYDRHDANKINVRMQSRYLNGKKGVIDNLLVKEIQITQDFRNMVVHKFGMMEVKDADLSDSTERIMVIIGELLKHEPEKLEKLKNVDLRK